MGSHVDFKVASLVARVVALWTNKGLLSRMSSNVYFKVGSCCARVVALWTNKGLLSWMGSRVDSKVASSCAREDALCTNKGFLSAVNSHVSFQLGRSDTWVAALLAIVTFLCRSLKFFRAGHLSILLFLIRVVVAMFGDDWWLNSYSGGSTCKKWKLRKLWCKMREFYCPVQYREDDEKEDDDDGDDYILWWWLWRWKRRQIYGMGGFGQNISLDIWIEIQLETFFWTPCILIMIMMMKTTATTKIRNGRLGGGKRGRKCWLWGHPTLSALPETSSSSLSSFHHHHFHYCDHYMIIIFHHHHDETFEHCCWRSNKSEGANFPILWWIPCLITTN